MEFAKALCVVLLLYSASFGESRTLEHSNSKKRVVSVRTIAVKSPKQIAQELEQFVRRLQGNEGGF